MNPRATNLSLFAVLGLVFATGLGAVMTGSAGGRWIVVAHGVAAIVVVALIPWKAVVIRRGLRRRRPSRWASLALALLVVAALVLGLVHTTGLVDSIGGFGVLWLHIAFALLLVPLLLLHVFTRPVRRRTGRPRSGGPGSGGPGSGRPAVGRRTALRLGGLAAASVVSYAVLESILRLTGAPGARRRFTGSHEIAPPAPLPVTSWLDDRVPTIDVRQWRLVVVDGAGRRELALADLPGPTRVRATLDCTSGWYATRDWTGVPVAALVSPGPQHRSLYVHSVTGYWIRFPIEDLPTLVLATGIDGRVLSRGHGFPLRLVAPGRRGYWWVKWVDRIELDATPAWWQPPLPTT